MELSKTLVLSATYIFILLTSPAGDKPYTTTSTEHDCDPSSANDVLQCWLEWRESPPNFSTVHDYEPSLTIEVMQYWLDWLESPPIFSTVHQYEQPENNVLDVLQSWLELLDRLDSQSKFFTEQDYGPLSNNDDLQFSVDSQSNLSTFHDYEPPSAKRWVDSLAIGPFWLKGDQDIACRNVWCAAELTFTRKPQLLQHYRSHFRNGRILFRNSLHNSRRSSRNSADSSPLEHLKIDSCPPHPRSLIKPFFFTIGVSAVGLGACMIWEYEALRTHASSFFRKASPWLSAQQRRKSKSEPGPITKWWNSLRENEKVFYPILAANVLVFGAWRVRQLQPYMIKYFCSNPSGSARCLPMLLSTFSHYSVMHLAANMYVLYSFMPAAVAALGKEQFTAMYLSAGVISSFASFVYKVLLNQPGLSLGASGAIMSVLSYVCMQYPDTRLSIIFLPMYTFAAGTAIKVIMGMDLAGVVFGWKFFDHAAHLGGALFGIYWCRWGSDTVWGNRDKFVQYYHSLRKNDSNR